MGAEVVGVVVLLVVAGVLVRHEMTFTWAWAPNDASPVARAVPAADSSALGGEGTTAENDTAADGGVPVRVARVSEGAPRPGGTLRIPVEGVMPADLHDSFDDARSGGRTHRAIDIMAERGTPVRAVAGGYVARRHASTRGGRSLYQFSADSSLVFYYAHLAGYADAAAEGARVEAGDVVGYVGATGNARTPHLHFAVWRVADPAHFWRGPALNPYPLLAGPAPGQG
jgi:murein DD-endopeptidase MepM/ murein hydrolase activator NlpD